MAEKQRTIASDIHLEGKGLHSGKQVNLIIKPAETDYGICFQRIDLDNKPIIRALAENVINTSRGTTISENGAEVMTIEHLCAALYGLGIDNVHIEIDAPEVPIFDGSAKNYVEVIKKFGIVDQDVEKKEFIVNFLYLGIFPTYLRNVFTLQFNEFTPQCNSLFGAIKITNT